MFEHIISHIDFYISSVAIILAWIGISVYRFQIYSAYDEAMSSLLKVELSITWFLESLSDFEDQSQSDAIKI